MNVDFIIKYENGEATEEEVVQEFQKMINDGSVWQMQGSYGRYAAELIESGICELGEEPQRDYYGNYVPSRYEFDKDKDNL